MQALLTTETDVTVSGINGIEQDAIEQPSQFLERWYVAHLLDKYLQCSPCCMLLFYDRAALHFLHGCAG